MKHFLSLMLLLCSITVVSAQSQNPVTWKSNAVKQANGTYKITLTATVPSPWHIYSQTTPTGGPVPTTFNFNKNPLVTMVGKTMEKGELKTMHDKNFGVEVKYYDGKVIFTQTVKVKKGIKTNVSGTINYMVCNDHECLPPSDEAFSVKLD